MPPTLRDSVLICERLGLTHIWIDSLCIIQDSPSDWAQEATRMGGIYAGSTLTIAISASSSVYDGAFNQCSLPYTKSKDFDKDWIVVDGTLRNGEKSRLYIGQRAAHGERFVAFYNRIGALSAPAVFRSPLTQRAWALQEQLLSPRTLYYTSTHLYWGCRHCMISEDNMYCGTAVREPSYHPAWATESELSGYWYDIVEDYSKRKLTFARDKLVALSALARARAVDPRRSDAYIAGLWTSSLLPGLGWVSIATEGRKIEQYSCPSWSWASQDSAVSYHMLYSQQPDDSMFTPSVVSVKWVPDPENPFADASSASIDLDTRIALGYLRYNTEGPSRLFPTIPGVDTWNDAYALPSFALAYMDDSGATTRSVAIAAVGHCDKSLVCLILDPPTLDANNYRRVGISWFSSKLGFGDDQRHITSKWRNRIITLV